MFTVLGDDDIPLQEDRLRCPDELESLREKELWMEVTESFTGDYFLPSDIPLLVEYIRWKVTLDKAARCIEESGEVIWNEKRQTYEHNPWLTIRAKGATAIGSLSQKLRISNASRTMSEKAQHSSRVAKNQSRFNPGSNWRDRQKKTQLDG